MEKLYGNAGIFFIALAAAIGGWWISLAFWPALRPMFDIDPGSDIAFIAFRLPDLLVLISSSLITGLLCLARYKYASEATWFVTGALSYATFYSLSVVMATDRGWLGVTLMLPALLWSGVFSTGLTFGREMFRQSKPGDARWVLAKTYAQIAIVWGLVLFVIPYLLTFLEDKIGLTRLVFPFQRVVAGVLFLFVSIIGLRSAHAMSRFGSGTPLPLDHAAHLVVKGPYAYVRNPMAATGILQGLAVALFFGSALVAAYAITGSLIWQLIFRPLEEEDLLRRFGEEYEAYRGSVRCWIPRRSPYIAG